MSTESCSSDRNWCLAGAMIEMGLEMAAAGLAPAPTLGASTLAYFAIATRYAYNLETCEREYRKCYKK